VDASGLRIQLFVQSISNLVLTALLFQNVRLDGAILFSSLFLLSTGANLVSFALLRRNLNRAIKLAVGSLALEAVGHLAFCWLLLATALIFARFANNDFFFFGLAIFCWASLVATTIVTLRAFRLSRSLDARQI
jgi:hypothetical protein